MPTSPVSESAITDAVEFVRSAEHELNGGRWLLREKLREAHEAGATAAQLVEWTGYSRRTIFYMLKENTK
jgi:hypothetical protein